MTTNIQKDGTSLTMTIEGRIDTQTAPVLEKAIKEAIEDVAELVLDFAQVGYISSAGLRTILTAQNWMDAKNGSMILKNCSKNIMSVFKVTGFDSFLTIE